MHCAICDKDSETVTVYEPCSECQEVIQDCLASYEAIPEEGEEENVDPEYDV